VKSVAVRRALANEGRLLLLAVLFAGGILRAAVGCQASESLPPGPSPATVGDAGDVSTESVTFGSCPGTGKVSVDFDGGSGESSCWEAFATMKVTETTVSLASNVTTPPGLGVAITLYEYDKGTTKCTIAAGTTFPPDSPCVFVSATYVSAANTYVWQAFGGSGATAPFPVSTEGGKPLAATGSLTVGSFSTTLGGPVSVSFSSGSTLVVNAPGYPRASISGSVQGPVQ
jgi:hypothetical protein